MSLSYRKHMSHPSVEESVQYSVKVVLMSSALLWCFATRHSTQAMAIVLVKCCNAVAEHQSNARSVGLSAPMAALRLLQRTTPFAARRALPRAMTDQLNPSIQP